MKKIYISLTIAAFLYACSGNAPKQDAAETTASGSDLMKEDKMAIDPQRGIGKFTHVDISPTLDAKMAHEGQEVYDLKCSSCHKTTDEKLVGPGWKGVTSRRKPEWIMNFVTNTDEMITKDPQAQSLLELCLVRMPNQNLSDDEARHVYEFMRKNDGVK
jgi:cytochrome c5